MTPIERIAGVTELREWRSAAAVLRETGADQRPRWRVGERLEQLFEQRCDATPDRLAVDATGSALTFTELDGRANRLARHLLASGVGPGARVALLLDDCTISDPCASSRNWTLGRVLVTGFQGISPSGDVTTLGRGGSDASAVAVAAALGLRECQIFTDVDGVFTADPRVVAGARRLPAIGRAEMLQLASAGAAVLQPRAVELASAHDVDIHVRSSFTGTSGTWIVEETSMFETADIVGVAHRDRESCYAVRGLSPAAITAALAGRGSAVGTVVRHRGEVLFTAPGMNETEVVAVLAPAGGHVTVQDEFGAVTVVGCGLDRRPDVAARALLALESEGIDPHLVTSTPSCVSFHIPAPRVHSAVRLLHDLFPLEGAAAVDRDLARVGGP